MRRVPAFVAAFLVAASLFAVPVQAASGKAGAHYAAGRYIVTFADEPVASYTGTTKGFAATSTPAPRPSSAGRPT